MDIQATRDAILEATLSNVAFDGWTQKALAMGAETVGCDDAARMRAFPDGIGDVIAHVSDWADRRMAAAIAAEQESFDGLRVREKVARAVQVRLQALAPYRDAVRRLLTPLSLPSVAQHGPHALYRTVDMIWIAAGDRSTDYNFYTKRLLLAGVLTSTTLYWISDDSDEHADTWRFLDRRIEDVMRAGKQAGRLKNLGPVFEAPLNLAAAIGGRLFGLNAQRATQAEPAAEPSTP